MRSRPVSGVSPNVLHSQDDHERPSRDDTLADSSYPETYASNLRAKAHVVQQPSWDASTSSQTGHTLLWRPPVLFCCRA
eukprot:2118900-Karenia_brevis.AAC.1